MTPPSSKIRASDAAALLRGNSLRKKNGDKHCFIYIVVIIIESIQKFFCHDDMILPMLRFHPTIISPCVLTS